ncbi:insulinase family protein [Vibrio sp.]|nr:insulinase family protein [Vibrio sp.]
MHISPNDNKQYRYHVLNNELRVLLVEDVSATRSSAALAVNIGHYHDPINRQGMAHFLEHMLFLGTHQFPDADDFQNFISQHGGSNNAWTGTEHTCFFFDIANNAFSPGLQRFSRFFIDPLFNVDLVEKERNAVDSEYKMKLNDDSRRIHQVLKETINPNHPLTKFSVGNHSTLEDRNETSIRDEVINFYQDHYSANLMTLTLVSPYSLDEQQEWVDAFFSPITNAKKAIPVTSEPYVTEKETSIKISIEPIKELRKLTVSFPLPNMNQYYRTKPLSFIAHLLGYEGPDSLMQVLKQKGWITSLTAGGGLSGSNFRDFNISFGLTEIGLDHKDTIIQYLFSYIDLIKREGMEEWRYLEKKAVLESAFRFQEPIRPMEFASHIVMNMQRYSPEDIIYGDYIMDEFSPKQMMSILDKMSITNARIVTLAHGQPCDKVADWYHTPYSVSPLSDDEIATLTSTQQVEALTLPSKNPYICYSLEPKPLDKPQPHPLLIESLPGFRLWHLQDTEFRVPKGAVYISIDSPAAVSSPKNIVLTRLCVEIFLDSLAEETYQAEVAGMGYTMYSHQGGVTLVISGFSEKQPELMKMILERFSSRNFSQDRFDSIKYQLLRSWQNAAQDRPVSQLFNALSGILQPNNPPHPVLFDALKEIEIDDLSGFVEQILSTLHVEMFVYGDWTTADAFFIGNTFKDALRVPEQSYEEAFSPLVMLGKQGSYQKELTCNQDDAAIVVYYQSDSIDAKSVAEYSLANHLMSATFFNEIRTKQQLGYMVGTGNLPLNRHPGIILYIQSPHVAPSDLIIAIDDFLDAFYLVLLELTEEAWESSKQGLINLISAPDNALRTRAQRLWVSIGNKDWDFNHRDQVTKQLHQLSKTDMVKFIINELKPRTANRLIMHTKGNSHMDTSSLHIGQEIGSIKEFQLKPKDSDVDELPDTPTCQNNEESS